MLIVRVNPLEFGRDRFDLDAVMADAPDAILLPGSLGAASVQQLSAKLAVREAEFALPDGGRGSSPSRNGPVFVQHGKLSRLERAADRGRLERGSLRADIGAEADRDRLGDYAGPYRQARDLTLLAATSARVAAIDAPFADLRDARVCAARRSPHGATASPAKWRSTRPRWASSTKYSRRR